MKSGWVIGVIFAVILHVGFILFGGLFLPEARKDQGTTRVVDLVADASAEEKKVQPKEPEKTPEKVENQDEPPPDAEKVAQSFENAEAMKAPALELASLGAIEAALGGQGGGEFGDALGFVSGGRIDGKGKGGALAQATDTAFSLAEIDQKPRAVFQASPAYPAEMRGKKVEGVVSILFVVDANGKVLRQRVEKSNNAAFEKPALEAVRQWKFEPAIKGGERVACKMRVPIRFPAS